MWGQNADANDVEQRRRVFNNFPNFNMNGKIGLKLFIHLI